MLAYKPDLVEVVDRHRRLWTGKSPNAILAAFFPDNLDFIDPLTCTPDIQAMAHAWEHNYRARVELHDDLLPVGRVSFGSAAFGAYLGAEVTFETWGGWTRPLLDDFSNLERLTFNPENEWVRLQAQACRLFVQLARGKFGLCETEPIDGLNLVELLRGSRAYTDIFDYPAELHRLLEIASDFNIRFIEYQRDILQPCLEYEDGSFSMFRIWLPGRAVWISVDAYGNCSPEVFLEFGKPYIQRSIDYFSGGWVHVHAFALHLLPEIMRMRGVLGIGVCDDPGVPTSFEKLAYIRSITRSMPLQIDCSCEQLEHGIRDGTLPGGVMYMVRTGVETITAANKIMADVRCYRAPSPM